jgi:predicted DNA-binding protein
MDQVKISFYAPKELRTELNVIAAKQDRTVTSILTELVQDFISENK